MKEVKDDNSIYEIEEINERSIEVTSVLFCQYYKSYLHVSEDLEATCYVMDRLEIKYYKLEDHLKEKENEWHQKIKEYGYQLQLFQEEYSKDDEINDLKEDKVDCNQNKNRIPYIIENLQPSIMKAILD